MAAATQLKPARKKRTAGADRDDLVFKVLANPDRRAIMDFIREAPKTTGEICQYLTWLDRCTVMQHLNALEKADLLIVKRRGKYRWNYLNFEPIQRIYNRWIKDYAAPASRLLTELKQHLESP